MSYQMTFADLSQDLNQPQEAKEIYRSKEICILHCPVCGDVVGVKLIHPKNAIEYSEECMRVLKKNGTLIFKWNESDIPTNTILDIIGAKPIYGHLSGKLSKTQWMAFVK